MRRALIAVSSVTFLLLAGRAVADDFKWDPKHRHAPPRVGQKSTDEVVEYRKFATKISSGGNTLQDMKDEGTTTYKITSEVIALEGKKVSEKLVKVDAWKLEKKGEDPDTSLEGHTIRVKGVGDARTATIEDDKEDKVSDEGKKWVESELAKKKKKKKTKEPAKDKDEDEDGELAAFMPTSPVADGAEWKPDLAELAKEVGLECEPDKSTATGSLTKVRVENGVHMGHIEVKVSMATKPPQVTWKEGGKMDITISLDTSLDADAPETSSGSFEVKFGGKGEAQSPQGPVNLKQSVEQKHTGKTTPVPAEK